MTPKRTPPKIKAQELANHLRSEQPDYSYLKTLFRHLRTELEIEVPRKPRRLPFVPTEEDLKKYYQVVWQSQNFQDMLIIKTLTYTGARVTELINIKIVDVDFDVCQIQITNGKGEKDRLVPFPESFRETLAMHASMMKKKESQYLFESSWKKKYSDRGVRKILERYSDEAGLPQTMSPHKLRHFLFTWLKKQGVDDSLIQPYSGHENQKSLEIYSKISITDAQDEYNHVIKNFPI